jgi:hypothetical protein
VFNRLLCFAVRNAKFYPPALPCLVALPLTASSLCLQSALHAGNVTFMTGSLLIFAAMLASGQLSLRIEEPAQTLQRITYW